MKRTAPSAICTSWATSDENVDRLCLDLDALLKAE